MKRFKTISFPPLFFLVLPCLSLVSSCGIYNSDFDCPAGRGVGCAPAGEVLDRIVEEDDGEDRFIKDRGEALLIKQEEKKEETPRKKKKKLHLVKTETGEWMLVKSSQGKTHDSY